jgi:hypothetical protein
MITSIRLVSNARERGARGTAALLSVAMLAGCVSHLPAPAIPEKVAPELPLPPPPPAQGEGQIVVDTTNGAARVSVLLSTSVLAATSSNGSYATGMAVQSRTVCTATPCAVNLPYGAHTLVFQSKGDERVGSNADVQVGQSPSYVRHTMGAIDGMPGLEGGGLLLSVLGGAGLIAGGILFAAAPKHSTSETTGKTTLGVGAGLLVAGVVMAIVGRPKIRPGASIQWTPEGPVRQNEPRSTPSIVQITPSGVQIAFQ